MTSKLKHVVALSGGKDSTAMALRLVELDPKPYLFVCTPTGDELPDMFEHWKMLSCKLAVNGSKFVPLVAGTLDSLIEGYNALPNWRQRWCTRQLKIEPFQKFLLSNLPCVSYVGLRHDENRLGVDYNVLEGVEHKYPLREWGWGLSDVLGYLKDQGITIPERTDCARCFFQTLGEWWKLWKDHPNVYADAEAQEVSTGHTFRSPSRDSWPAELKELRVRFEGGQTPKNANQLDLFRQSTCRECTL